MYLRKNTSGGNQKNTGGGNIGYAVNSVAAATAVLGYDLLQGQIHQISAVNRVLQGVSLTGSAAIGDTKVDLYVDTVKVAEVWNSKLLIGNMDDIVMLDNLFVPAGAALHAIVTDAPVTNPVFLGIRTAEI